PTSNTALQIGFLAHARVLRRRRDHANPPVQARTARLGERRDLRRSLRLRPRRDRAAVRERQAHAVFGEGSGARRHARRRSEGDSTDLGRLLTLSSSELTLAIQRPHAFAALPVRIRAISGFLKNSAHPSASPSCLLSRMVVSAPASSNRRTTSA